MAAPTVTFPCPFCGRRMGVPAELLGRQVRCPHCKQVLLAPVNAGPGTASTPTATQPPTPTQTSPPPAPAPTPVIQIVSPPPAPAPRPSEQPTSPPPVTHPQPVAHKPEPELPTFKVAPPKEGADSIMSEPDESDDEVFRSHPSSRLTVSAASNFGPPSEHDLRADAEKMTVVHTVPSTPQQEPANPTPPVEGSESNPFADLKSVNIPITPTPSASIHPTPAPVASQPSAPVPIMPVPIPNTPESVNDNPFTEFEVSAAAPTPATPGKVKVTPIPIEPELDKNRPHKQQKLAPKDDNELDEQKETEQDEAGTEQTVRGRDRTAAKASGGINPVILFAVIGYAVLATAIAVYGMFFKSSDAVDTGHPLSTIPDNFGEFDPATRKKVSLYKFRVDGELPAAQRGKLGDKIVVGDLEIQPEEIVKRRLTIETESKSGDEKLVNYTGPALVLRLKITNNSDVSLYPMDPAFTRRSVGDDRPITRIVVDKKNVFAGGAITWPFGDRVKKQMEHQQANDYVPLAPGDKREYVVFTDAKPNIIKAVESSKDTMEWRIQVRRAPISYRHKEIPVTAIIGVDFTAADIKG